MVNPLNAELNPILHLLALLETHHILQVSRIRVNVVFTENREISSPLRVLPPKSYQRHWKPADKVKLMNYLTILSLDINFQRTHITVRLTQYALT